MKKIILFGITISLTTIFNFNAQDYVMNAVEFPGGIVYNDIGTPSLTKNKVFSYKYNGKNVTVAFEGTEHIEYFNKKKYYIKSRVFWNSKHECSMIFEESNLPKFSFEKGTKIDVKITKIKHGYIYYESSLGGRTWEGKMKEI